MTANDSFRICELVRLALADVDAQQLPDGYAVPIPSTERARRRRDYSQVDGLIAAYRKAIVNLANVELVGSGNRRVYAQTLAIAHDAATEHVRRRLGAATWQNSRDAQGRDVERRTAREQRGKVNDRGGRASRRNSNNLRRLLEELDAKSSPQR